MEEDCLFVKSHFLLDQVDDQVCVRHLLAEETAAGCTIGRRQANRGSVMLCAMAVM